jgi:hypothetical protein
VYPAEGRHEHSQSSKEFSTYIKTRISLTNLCDSHGIVTQLY